MRHYPAIQQSAFFHEDGKRLPVLVRRREVWYRLYGSYHGYTLNNLYAERKRPKATARMERIIYSGASIFMFSLHLLSISLQACRPPKHREFRLMASSVTPPYQ